jgi:GrpB-like predicted nucleotidyltransferase (UPF0157 family)/ribosomal protein S18 acetylase RimI-like enzyme
VLPVSWSLDAPIETDRLTLRAHRAGDLDDLAVFHGDPEVTAYIPWPVRDREQTAAALAERIARTCAAAPGDVLSLAVEERASGLVIGEVLLRRLTGGAAEIGYAIRRDRWGRGLAGEAVAALIEVARGRWAVTELEAVVEPPNTASLALLERLGFRREPQLRGGLVVLRPVRDDEDPQRSRVDPLTPHDAPITLVDHDPRWPAQFEQEAARIRGLLGERVVLLEHVGSTAVPGLVAKPIIDIVLVVADPAQESGYVPPLEAAGYRLTVREPDWFAHRMLTGPTGTAVHLHVFGAGTAEVDRMLRFRDRLRTHVEDRDRYARTKRELAARTWRHVQHYADAKTAVVQQILDRAAG